MRTKYFAIGEKVKDKLTGEALVCVETRFNSADGPTGLFVKMADVADGFNPSPKEDDDEVITLLTAAHDLAQANGSLIEINEKNAIRYSHICHLLNESTPDINDFGLDSGVLLQNGVPVTQQGQIEIEEILGTIPGKLILFWKQNGYKHIGDFRLGRDRFTRYETFNDDANLLLCENTPAGLTVVVAMHAAETINGDKVTPVSALVLTIGDNGLCAGSVGHIEHSNTFAPNFSEMQVIDNRLVINFCKIETVQDANSTAPSPEQIAVLGEYAYTKVYELARPDAYCVEVNFKVSEIHEAPSQLTTIIGENDVAFGAEHIHLNGIGKTLSGCTFIDEYEEDDKSVCVFASEDKIIRITAITRSDRGVTYEVA